MNYIIVRLSIYLVQRVKKCLKRQRSSYGDEKNPTEQWDRYSIEAEIKRRGKSVTQLAKDYGMSDRTVRNALYHPSKKGEIVISKFLGRPLHELFPERWTVDNKRIYSRYSNKECTL